MCASASNRSNVCERYSKGTHQPTTTYDTAIVTDFRERDECTLAGGVAVIGVYVHAKRALRVENFPCATSISPLPNRALIDQLRFHRFQSVWIGEQYVEAIYPENDDDLVLRLIYFIFDRALRSWWRRMVFLCGAVSHSIRTWHRVVPIGINNGVSKL